MKSTSDILPFHLLVCFSIYMPPVVLLNDTTFYSSKLQNVTGTNHYESEYPLQKGNESHQGDLDMSGESFVYFPNGTNTISKSDDIHADKSNSAINNSTNEFGELHTFLNEDKLPNDLQRESIENQERKHISLAPTTHSQSKDRTLIMYGKDDRENQIPYQYNVKNEEDPRSSKNVLTTEKLNQTAMNWIKRKLVTRPNQVTDITRKVTTAQSLMFENSNDQTNHVTTSKTRSEELVTRLILNLVPFTTDEPVLHPHRAGKKHKHHKTMHHLNLVPIEDGPFGSLIWKDKKYLISVLIPIIIGIVGAACIIGMTYTARYCQKYEPKIRDFRATVTNQVPPSNDQIVLLSDSSDEL